MSAQTLSFSDSVSYGSLARAARSIGVQIRLSADMTVAWDVDARVDSGFSFCVFGRQWADLLGLDWEAGEPIKISTAAGAFDAHLHEVTIQLDRLGRVRRVGHDAAVSGERRSWVERVLRSFPGSHR